MAEPLPIRRTTLSNKLINQHFSNIFMSVGWDVKVVPRVKDDYPLGTHAKTVSLDFEID